MNLLDRLGEFIIELDKNGIITYINDSAHSVFGIKKGDNVKVVFKKDDRDIFFVNLIRIVEKYGKYENFMRFIDKNNNLIFCWFNSFIWENAIVFEIFDLSKANTTSININDTNYANLLKYMSEGVAHSIRNPIMSAGGMLNRLKNKLPENTPNSVFSYIEIVEKSLYKIMHIIANIEVVSNSFPITLKKIDLNYVIKTVVEKYKQYENIKFDIKTDKNIEIFADLNHISFVVEEIIKNSYDAANGKGIIITIEIKRKNDNAVITVSDNGPGIEEGEMPLVMIPFYSTKPSNMGVGLSLSKFIIEGYGGKIDIDSKIGVGTTVSITLPIEKRNRLRREVVDV